MTPVPTPQPPPDLVLADTWVPGSDLAKALRGRFEQIVSGMPLGLMAVDREGRVQLWNAAAERMFGFTASEVMGKLLPIIPDQLRPQHHQIVGLGFTEAVHGVQLRRVRKDGSPLEIQLWTTRVLSPSGEVVALLGITSDETERIAQERAIAQKSAAIHLLQEVAVAANESDAIEPALRRALRLIGGHLGFPLGHALLVDAVSGELKPTALWHDDGSTRFERFQRASEGQRFSSGRDLAARVLADRHSEWVVDLTQDPQFFRAAAAREAGLVTAFAVPLLVRSEVAGVLEFFSTERRPPDPNVLEVMQHVGTQLGRVIERSRAEQERVQLQEQAKRAEREAAEAKRQQVLRKLSERERDVMSYVAGGADNLKIAACLGITERTVKAHVTSLLRKLDLENRTQVAILAITLGVVGANGTT